MYTSDLSDFDQIVLMLLQQPLPVPTDDLVGIVQHYLTRPAPRPRHVDLLLVALARPEFDDALLDEVLAARPDTPLQVRGARLAGLAARPGAEPGPLLRAERSLTARLVAAELTLSPHLLAALVVAAPPKLLAVALQNPHRPDAVDLAAIDVLERPHGYLPQNLAGMLRRTPRVERRVRASDHYSLRYLAWDWCDSPAERLAFAVQEITRAVEADEAGRGRLIDAVLASDEAEQLPPGLLRRLETLLDAELTARADDDSFSAIYWRSHEQKTLDQVRRLLNAQADDPHPSVAVLFDRILHSDYGAPTAQAEQIALAEASALLGHGADFWPALAESFDPEASVPDLVVLAQLLSSRSTSAQDMSAVASTVSG